MRLLEAALVILTGPDDGPFWSASWDDSLHLWDMTSGTAVRTISPNFVRERVGKLGPEDLTAFDALGSETRGGSLQSGIAGRHASEDTFRCELSPRVSRRRSRTPPLPVSLDRLRRWLGIRTFAQRPKGHQVDFTK